MGADTTSGPAPRLVERWFPSVELSRLVAADRRLRDPVYGVHRWFARRPATLVRALLLGADLPATATAEMFWERHRSPQRWLSGVTVYDPFLGGGTSLVEAARMGANVAGRDVDPLAVSLSSIELHPEVSEAAAAQANLLIAHLRDLVGDLYAPAGTLAGTTAQTAAGPTPAGTEWTPLHWFWLRRVTCPHCAEMGLLYRDLVLARSVGQRGSVVRSAEVSAFCPDCLVVHSLEATRKELVCCRRRPLSSGTFAAGIYHCGECGGTSNLEELKPANAERVMVAVEETHASQRRRIRTATSADRQRENAAEAKAAASRSPIFSRLLATQRRDRRPVSHGFETVGSLFLPRQQLLLGAAMSWIEERGLPDTQRQALTLFVTGLLTSNNALCGYARDYGRLAPLFSVRGYPFPTLSVELNPLHPTAGRGTLLSGLRRLAKLAETSVQRHTMANKRPVRVDLDLPVQAGSVDVVCGSADDTSGHPDLEASVCVTDPPYFDYIVYSELSEFFRVWLADPDLGGEPLLPAEVDAVGSFADRLAACLKVTLTRLAPNTPLVFTYHTRHQRGWETIGLALDEAGFVVTAAWPVLADPGMGAHRGPGNCEWDVVLTCRPAESEKRAEPPAALEWISELTAAGFTINQADRDSFTHALSTFAGRFAPVSAWSEDGLGPDMPPSVAGVR